MLRSIFPCSAVLLCLFPRKEPPGKYRAHGALHRRISKQGFLKIKQTLCDIKVWRNFPPKTEIFSQIYTRTTKKFQNCPFFFWSKNDNIWPQKQKKKHCSRHKKPALPQNQLQVSKNQMKIFGFEI
jgi:hypothetical protein